MNHTKILANFFSSKLQIYRMTGIDSRLSEQVESNYCNDERRAIRETAELWPSVSLL